MTRREQKRSDYLSYLKEIEQEEIDKNAEAVAAFIEHCAALGCQLTRASFAYSHPTGLTANAVSIVKTLLPDLPTDKDGLYNLRLLQDTFKPEGLNPFDLAGGYFRAKNFILFAHPLFRRSYYEGNNYAPSFIDYFWRLRNPDVKASIALDLDRVRIDLKGGAYFEKDTWYGAPFTQDISCIPNGVAKYRPSTEFDEDDIALFLNNTYSLDVAWNTSGGIKTFYAEEFKDENVILTYEGGEYFPARYIHAEYDIADGYFRHFDGAFHLYELEDYQNRRDSDFNFNRKNQSQIKGKSKKVFRLDGVIDIALWAELTTQFFHGNPLIIEYFTGKNPDYLQEILNKLRNR